MELFKLTKEKAQEYKEHLYLKKDFTLHLRLFNNTPTEASVPGLLDIQPTDKNGIKLKDIKLRELTLEAKRTRKKLKSKYSNINGWRTDTKADPVSFKIVQSKNRYIDITLSDECLGIYKSIMSNYADQIDITL